MGIIARARVVGKDSGGEGTDGTRRWAGVSVLVRLWASARDAAGVAEERVAAGSLADVVAALLARHPDRARLPAVLQVCSYVVDGRPAGTRDRSDVQVPDGAEVDVLPPFAGG